MENEVQLQSLAKRLIHIYNACKWSRTKLYLRKNKRSPSKRCKKLPADKTLDSGNEIIHDRSNGHGRNLAIQDSTGSKTNPIQHQKQKLTEHVSVFRTDTGKPTSWRCEKNKALSPHKSYGVDHEVNICTCRSCCSATKTAQYEVVNKTKDVEKQGPKQKNSKIIICISPKNIQEACASVKTDANSRLAYPKPNTRDCCCTAEQLENASLDVPKKKSNMKRNSSMPVQQMERSATIQTPQMERYPSIPMQQIEMSSIIPKQMDCKCQCLLPSPVPREPFYPSPPSVQQATTRSCCPPPVTMNTYPAPPPSSYDPMPPTRFCQCPPSSNACQCPPPSPPTNSDCCQCCPPVPQITDCQCCPPRCCECPRTPSSGSDCCQCSKSCKQPPPPSTASGCCQCCPPSPPSTSKCCQRPSSPPKNSGCQCFPLPSFQYEPHTSAPQDQSFLPSLQYQFAPPNAQYQSPPQIAQYQSPPPITQYQSAQPIAQCQSPLPVAQYQSPPSIAQYQSPSMNSQYYSPSSVAQNQLSPPSLCCCEEELPQVKERNFCCCKSEQTNSMPTIICTEKVIMPTYFDCYNETQASISDKVSASVSEEVKNELLNDNSEEKHEETEAEEILKKDAQTNTNSCAIVQSCTSEQLGYVHSAVIIHPKTSAPPELDQCAGVCCHCRKPVPSTRQMRPQEQDALSNQFQMPPIQHQTSPVHPTPPIQQHTSPIQQHTSPIQQHTSPIQQHTSPIQQHMSPIRQHTSPIQHHMSPIQHHTSPIQHHTPPIQHHTSPIHRTPPMQYQTSPMQSQMAPNQYLIPPRQYQMPPEQPLPPMYSNHQAMPSMLSSPPMMYSDQMMPERHSRQPFPPRTSRSAPKCSNLFPKGAGDNMAGVNDDTKEEIKSILCRIDETLTEEAEQHSKNMRGIIDQVGRQAGEIKELQVLVKGVVDEKKAPTCKEVEKKIRKRAKSKKREDIKRREKEKQERAKKKKEFKHGAVGKASSHQCCHCGKKEKRQIGCCGQCCANCCCGCCGKCCGGCCVSCWDGCCAPCEGCCPSCCCGCAQCCETCWSCGCCPRRKKKGCRCT